MSDETRDSNGTLLADGDTVTLIKDLKVKGSGGVTLKRGTVVKKIRLTGDPDEIEANVSAFLKSSDGQELALVFPQIEDNAVRKQFLGLARAMANASQAGKLGQT